MASEERIQDIVAQVMAKLGREEAAPAPADSGESLPDVTATPLQEDFWVPAPANRAEYMRMKARTPARLGVWRAGVRLKTNTLLRFRADHAVAVDAVFTEVPEELIREAGLPSFRTKCASKAEYLQRPDLGRLFDDEMAAEMKRQCKNSPLVQVFVADGLSSTAVTANLNVVLPSVMQGLKSHGIEAGTPFFVRYGRVGAMDAVAEILGSTVTVALIGERPGLATGESMSAYMTYKGHIGMPEAARTVISNIHRGGTPPAEAGAHIADIVRLMLEKKASGLDLKL